MCVFDLIDLAIKCFQYIESKSTSPAFVVVLDADKMFPRLILLFHIS